MDLGKFNPDDFETHEMAFITLLAQMYGAQGENLKYIMHDVIIPAEFVNDAERRMYQLPLTDEHQGREFIANGALENGAFCTVFSENFHKF
jgi:hypothetical protein